MSLFSSLHPLAQKATLIVLITAEGNQLCVNVRPQATGEKTVKKTLYPSVAFRLYVLGMFIPLKVPSGTVFRAAEPA